MKGFEKLPLKRRFTNINLSEAEGTERKIKGKERGTMKFLRFGAHGSHTWLNDQCFACWLGSPLSKTQTREQHDRQPHFAIQLAALLIDLIMHPFAHLSLKAQGVRKSTTKKMNNRKVDWIIWKLTEWLCHNPLMCPLFGRGLEQKNTTGI